MAAWIGPAIPTVQDAGLNAEGSDRGTEEHT